jgi:GNAT superfamily N-acetyltransferase
MSANQNADVRPPQTPAEWERYFDLRWRVLRAPWGQPRGSERDEREAEAFHVAMWNEDGMPTAIGRLHLNSPSEAQVRFVAVDPALARRGLGSRIMSELERIALGTGAERIVLNSRDTAVDFYLHLGYATTGSGGVLFGEVRHVRMEKVLNR